MNKRIWKLSASFIKSFKRCAYECYAKYILGIRIIEEAETLRTGTNWHKLLEVLRMDTSKPCPVCSVEGPDEDCDICGGKITLDQDPLNNVMNALNAAYNDKPLSKSTADWEAEREKMWVCLVGYYNYYKDDDYEVIAQEIPFEVPLFNKKGRKLPGVILVGKIDKITRSPDGQLYIDEHKSTSKPIDSDSQYWAHLTLDTQTTLYSYAARCLQLWGELEQYGIKSNDPLIAGVRLDAWHKPQIKPKKLTIAESKKFVETGMYVGDKFDILTSTDFPEVGHCRVNDVVAEVTTCAKEGQYQIRETAEMYGARMSQDIVADPGKYYARKNIARTDADLERFERELNGIYRTVKFMDKGGADFFWKSEDQCEATFKCPLIGVCYNNVVLDADNVPEGFKCIYKKEDADV